MRRFAFMLFHWVVILFAITLIVVGFVPVHAQQPTEITDLTRRVESLEALNTDHRLTVIETKIDSLLGDHWSHLGTMIGTGLLILERAARAMKKETAEA